MPLPIPIVINIQSERWIGAGGVEGMCIASGPSNIEWLSACINVWCL